MSKITEVIVPLILNIRVKVLKPEITDEVQEFRIKQAVIRMAMDEVMSSGSFQDVVVTFESNGIEYSAIASAVIDVPLSAFEAVQQAGRVDRVSQGQSKIDTTQEDDRYPLPPIPKIDIDAMKQGLPYPSSMSYEELAKITTPIPIFFDLNAEQDN